jgi:hypothetical protein
MQKYGLAHWLECFIWHRKKNKKSNPLRKHNRATIFRILAFKYDGNHLIDAENNLSCDGREEIDDITAGKTEQHTLGSEVALSIRDGWDCILGQAAKELEAPNNIGFEVLVAPFAAHGTELKQLR